jgi:hypothetical protein
VIAGITIVVGVVVFLFLFRRAWKEAKRESRLRALRGER